MQMTVYQDHVELIPGMKHKLKLENQSIYLLGKATVHSLLTPDLLYKNGPWAWNISLLGDKGPSQHVLAYHLVKKYFSLFWTWCILLCSAYALCQWPSVRAQLSVFQTPQRRHSFHYSTKWGAYSHTAHVGCKTAPPAMGDQHITRNWIFCTLSLSSCCKQTLYCMSLVCMLSVLSDL